MFPYIGNFIIPTDELTNSIIFQRGWEKPPTRSSMIIIHPFLLLNILTKIEIWFRQQTRFLLGASPGSSRSPQRPGRLGLSSALCGCTPGWCRGRGSLALHSSYWPAICPQFSLERWGLDGLDGAGWGWMGLDGVRELETRHKMMNGDERWRWSGQKMDRKGNKNIQKHDRWSKFWSGIQSTSM